MRSTKGIISISFGDVPTVQGVQIVQFVEAFDVPVVQTGFFKDLSNFINLKYNGSIDPIWSNSSWIM